MKVTLPRASRQLYADQTCSDDELESPIKQPKARTKVYQSESARNQAKAAGRDSQREHVPQPGADKRAHQSRKKATKGTSTAGFTRIQ